MSLNMLNLNQKLLVVNFNLISVEFMVYIVNINSQTTSTIYSTPNKLN